MTSIGIMASSVVGAIDVLLEPFNNFTAAPWTLGSNCTIVAGRTSTGASLAGTPATVFAKYPIPAGAQASTMMVGFAYRVNNVSGTRSICQFSADSGTISHVNLSVLTDGTLQARLGSTGGTLLAASATAAIPINTYKYIELQANLSDTVGFVTLRIDGVQVATATNVDTKNAGTNTVFDSFGLLGPNAGITNIFDDLYITTGDGAAFKGNITIP